MSPLNFGGIAEFMGPLTSGGMMNQQYRNAMAESEVNQNKGLEDILTAQQNRDIAQQKLPGELEMQRANIEGKKVDTADKQSKLDREKYGYFLEDVIRFTPTNDPMADAFRLEETAKRAGLDPQDARVRFALTQAQNKEQLLALQKALTFNDPKHQQKLVEQRELQTQQASDNLARERLSQSGQTRRTQMQIDANAALEDKRIAAGKYEKTNRFASGFDNELARAKGAADKLAVINQYIAMASTDPDLQPLMPKLQELRRQMEPQARAELSARNNPNAINAPAITGMPANPPAQLSAPNVNAMPGVPTQPQAAPQPQAQQAPVKVSSDAEYLALPKGTVYISPDGKQRTKQ